MQTHEFWWLMGLLETLSAEQRAQLQLQLTAGGGARCGDDHRGAHGTPAMLPGLWRETSGA